MRSCQYTTDRTAVQRHARGLVQAHLRLPDYSPKCSASLVWTVLLAAAGWTTSLYEACQRLLAAPSDETIRQAVLAGLPGYAELQRRLNRALAGDLPRALRRRRQRLAIDLVLFPYHGEPDRDAREVYRSKAKGGTSHFHAYATAYVIRKGRRYTVALTPVAQGEPLKAVVQRLLRQAGRAGIRPALVLLDRGFYQVEVIRYLQAARYPFLMPVIGRGPKANTKEDPRGSGRFRYWKRSGWATYTLRGAQKRTATVGICVRCRNYRGQWDRHHRQALVYAYWGLTPASFVWVSETYRQRFGIETSYRQLRQARVRTTSRKPQLRLLFVGLALLLRNVWVWLHYEVLAERRRGGRRLQLGLLPLAALLVWLVHEAEARLGANDVVEAVGPT